MARLRVVADALMEFGRAEDDRLKSRNSKNRVAVRRLARYRTLIILENMGGDSEGFGRECFP